MTKDFRHIGLTSADHATAKGATPPAAISMVLPNHQRLILRVIVFVALGFLAAGLWLLTGGVSPLPGQTSFFLGIALVISAIADFGIVFVLKRIWSKPR